LNRRLQLLFVAVVVLWGLNWPFMKMALAELDFWVFRTWCVLAGLVWFLAYNLRRRISFAIAPEHRLRLLVVALANVAGWNLLSASGLALLPAGRAGVLAYTMPLWVVLIARFALGEPLSFHRACAIAVGMTGIVLLLVDEIHSLQSAPIGALLMVASGLVWAIGIVLTKGFPASLPTTTLMFWSFVLGGWPVVLGALVTSTGPWLPSGASAWLGLLFNVLIVFGFCWFAWNELVRNLPPQVTGISSLAVPFTGFVSGMVLLGEQPRPYDYLALAALLAAVALVLRPARPSP